MRVICVARNHLNGVQASSLKILCVKLENSLSHSASYSRYRDITTNLFFHILQNRFSSFVILTIKSIWIFERYNTFYKK